MAWSYSFFSRLFPLFLLLWFKAPEQIIAELKVDEEIMGAAFSPPPPPFLSLGVVEGSAFFNHQQRGRRRRDLSLPPPGDAHEKNEEGRQVSLPFPFFLASLEDGGSGDSVYPLCPSSPRRRQRIQDIGPFLPSRF